MFKKNIYVLFIIFFLSGLSIGFIIGALNFHYSIKRDIPQQNSIVKTEPSPSIIMSRWNNSIKKNTLKNHMFNKTNKFTLQFIEVMQENGIRLGDPVTKFIKTFGKPDYKSEIIWYKMSEHISSWHYNFKSLNNERKENAKEIMQGNIYYWNTDSYLYPSPFY